MQVQCWGYNEVVGTLPTMCNRICLNLQGAGMQKPQAQVRVQSLLPRCEHLCPRVTILEFLQHLTHVVNSDKGREFISETFKVESICRVMKWSTTHLL